MDVDSINLLSPYRTLRLVPREHYFRWSDVSSCCPSSLIYINLWAVFNFFKNKSFPVFWFCWRRWNVILMELNSATKQTIHLKDYFICARRQPHPYMLLPDRAYQKHIKAKAYVPDDPLAACRCQPKRPIRMQMWNTTKGCSTTVGRKKWKITHTHTHTYGGGDIVCERTGHTESVDLCLVTSFFAY